ncbi:MAG TPA: hypothetical protein VNY07_09475 [Chthoniobacterales bacterium]|jgi:hypothetical protein|nr:hypothetical protein [Chthoniobacterales bacterium]
MNWEMLAAIGQLAAVLIGIPSLIYGFGSVLKRLTSGERAQQGQ